MTRARAVRFDGYGDRDVLYVTEVEIPDPGPGEVLVEICAAAINPGETAIRSGAMRERFPATFPSGQGSDLAGAVRASGPGVDDLSAGDEVLGFSWTRSSHATHSLVPAEQLVPKPPAVSWPVAATLGVAGVTAWAAVEAVAPREGETVAVAGAAGGVGTFVTQLLARRGVRVLGIASADNAEWLSAHGATAVPYGACVRENLAQAAPQGIDAFIDLFGPDYLDLALELGVAPARIETIISFARAEEIGAQTKGSADASNRGVLAAIADLIAAGELEVPIAATYPLDEVRDAFAVLEARHTRGKIVLIP